MKTTARLLALLCALALAAPAGAADTRGAAQILVIGDSLLASNALTGHSVGAYLSRMLDRPVKTRPVVGARMIYSLPISGAMGFSIPKQYKPGPWQWVVVNGGGNDLWLGCGCNRCAAKLDRLISSDGRRGAIPTLVTRIRKSGARVIYVGYLRSPGFDTPIERCKNEGDALEARVARLAASDEGVFFLSLTDLVPEGDESYHMADLIHPSAKGSRAIALRIARLIAAY